MTEKIFLIGDVGGTNARFALASPFVAGYRDEQVLQCADFESPELAAECYLDSLGVGLPEVVCLAAAGPVLNNCVDLTNNNWRLRDVGLSEAFGGARIRILNDFAAIAQGLPMLEAAQLQCIGRPPAPRLDGDSFSVGVIGPGTGLGAAGLMRRDGHTIALVTEAGHVGFAPETARQQAVWELLRRRLGRVSDERLVSGRGLENILLALAQLAGEPERRLKVSDIFAQAETNPLAGEAVELFFEVLGQVTGNFALAIGAFDGVYIGGGIARRYEAGLAASNFRASFENKGRHRSLMERIPVMLIRHPHPGLLGAALAARELAD